MFTIYSEVFHIVFGLFRWLELPQGSTLKRLAIIYAEDKRETSCRLNAETTIYHPVRFSGDLDLLEHFPTKWRPCLAKIEHFERHA